MLILRPQQAGKLSGAGYLKDSPKGYRPQEILVEFLERTRFPDIVRFQRLHGAVAGTSRSWSIYTQPLLLLVFSAILFILL